MKQTIIGLAILFALCISANAQIVTLNGTSTISPELYPTYNANYLSYDADFDPAPTLEFDFTNYSSLVNSGYSIQILAYDSYGASVLGYASISSTIVSLQIPQLARQYVCYRVVGGPNAPSNEYYNFWIHKIEE